MAKTKRGVVKYTCGYYDYYDNKIKFTYWNNAKRKVRSIESDWYFRIRSEDFRLLKRGYFDEIAKSVEEDGSYLKIHMPFNTYQRKDMIQDLVNQNIEPLEADVNPVDRYIYDHEIQFGNPRVIYYDIETDGRGGWDRLDTHQLLSIAYSIGGAPVKCILASGRNPEDERRLLNLFLDEIAGKGDVLVGWNSENYDDEVVKARAKILGLTPNWRIINFLDMMGLFKKYFLRDASGTGIRTSYALDNIAKTVLGMGKLEKGLGAKTHILFEEDPEKLKAYNIRDVQILIDLEKKLRYIDFQNTLANTCNRFLSNWALRSAYLVDGFILNHASKNSQVRYGLKRGIERYDDDNEGKIKGAIVRDPILGLHEGICDLDFSSLYPSILIAFNVSPETYCGQGTKNLGGEKFSVAMNNATFSKEAIGIFPSAAKIALEQRQVWKDRAARLEDSGKEDTQEFQDARQRSDVWKVLANSMYGCLSAQHTRYFNRDMGEAITLTGQGINKKVWELASLKGIPVVYGDTDSTFVQCSKTVAKEFAIYSVEKVEEMLVQRGALPGYIKLKMDAEYARIFFTAKKKYAGKKVTGKIDIKGYEYVKSDGCKFGRDFQKEIIEYVLNSDSISSNGAEDIVQAWSAKLYEGKATAEDLLFSQGINRELAEYKGSTVHLRIAENMMKEGKEVYTGMKIQYIITGKKEGRLDAIRVDQFEGKYDAEIYWQAKVYPGVKRILEVVFPMASEKWDRWENYVMVSTKNQMTLFESTIENDTVVFRLHEADHPKLMKLKEICQKYPGNRPLKLQLLTSTGKVNLSTSMMISLTKELITELENETNRRIYFGAENWEN